MRNVSKVIGVMIGLGFGAVLVGAAMFLSRIATQPQFPPTLSPTPTATSTPTRTATPTASATPTPIATSIGTFVPVYSIMPGIESSWGGLFLNLMTVQNTRDVQVLYDVEHAPILPMDHQYLWVELVLWCYPTEVQPCLVNSDDFGIRTPQGIEYQPVPPHHYEMENLFSTLELEPDQVRHSRVLFIIPTIDTTMYLFYPRSAGLKDQNTYLIQ